MENNGLISSGIDEYYTSRQKKYGASFVFSITNACPLKCKHCIVDANSSVTELPSIIYEQCLNQFNEINNSINLIGVTGGEPFYVPQKLKIFSDFCSKDHNNRFKLSVITSAFWASSLIKAHDIIRKYQGITHYTFSTDKYHLHHVPITYIKNAYLAAKHLGKIVGIRISGENETTIKNNIQLCAIYDFISDKNEIAFQRLIPIGRARSNCQSRFQYSEQAPLLPCFANAPLVKENGDVDPCCSALVSLNGKHPMTLGNVYEDPMETIFSKMNSNWIFNYIRLWGLGDFITAIESSHLRNRLSGMYLKDDVCSTCWELFSDEDIAAFIESMSKSFSFRLKVAIGMNEVFDDGQALKLLAKTYNI